MMRIAAICVNFNNSEFTQSYIASLIDLNDEDLESIIIVDNKSNHEDVEKLSRYCSNFETRVTLIKNNTNIGYFPAINVGLAAIDPKKYQFIVIGNNDLTFDSLFLKNLKKLKYSKKVQVIAPNIIKPNGEHQNPHIIEKFSRSRNFYRYLYFKTYSIAVILDFIIQILHYLKGSRDRKNHEFEQEILMGYGACYVLTENFFARSQKLDAPVFLMGEEGILANQIIENNGITIYNPTIKVYHHDHTSIGKLPNRKLYNYSRISYQYYIKNLKNLHG